MCKRLALASQAADPDGDRLTFTIARQPGGGFACTGSSDLAASNGPTRVAGGVDPPPGEDELAEEALRSKAVQACWALGRASTPLGLPPFPSVVVLGTGPVLAGYAVWATTPPDTGPVPSRARPWNISPCEY